MTVPVTRHYVDGRFGQMHFYLAESRANSVATPLVCFHMSPYSGLVYEPLLGTIGERRPALAVDTPGFGNSTAPASQPSIADYAAAMADLLDTLDFEQVALMGYHTGSLIAVELARHRPTLVPRIVLVSAPIWNQGERADNALTAPRQVTEDGSDLEEMWRQAVHWSMEGRSLEMIARVFPERLLNPAIIHWGHVAAHDYHLAERLAQLQQPVLILNPEDDLCQQSRRAEQYLKHPESRIRELPGWSHGFLDVKPGQASDMIEEFLNG